jgi:putative DNA primase/helicase
VGRNGGIPNDLYRLRAARLVTAAEAEAGKRLAESLVKQLTGGDPILVKKLYHDPFEIVPQFLPILATNHKPQILGTDHAIWRRVRLVPFTVTIPDDEQDKALSDKLRAEYAGILRWLVVGCVAWQCDGLKPPQPVVDANREYRSEQDVLYEYLSERCRFVATGRVSKAELGRDYEQWCGVRGVIPQSRPAMGRLLRERGLRPTASRGVDYWVGLELRPQ